jgi:hypothetical protein
MGLMEGKKTIIIALLIALTNCLSNLEIFILPDVKNVSSGEGSREDPFKNIEKALESVKNKYDDFQANFILLGNQPKEASDGLYFSLSGHRKNLIIESDNNTSSTLKYLVNVRHLMIKDGANLTFKNLEIIFEESLEKHPSIDIGSLGCVHFEVTIYYIQSLKNNF